LIVAENSTPTTTAGAQAIGIYTQTGVNLASFDFVSTGMDSAEIGSNLNLSGGFLWSYDGFLPVEQNFFIYPELDGTMGSGWTTATTGGFMSAQVYFYVAVYEWTDNQGNAFRSAGSIPIEVDIHTSGTSTNTVSINIPTLRLTYKISNPVKITLYRWSDAQQVYYQVTSITSPLLNDTTVDYETFVDTLSDATILGNEILYTTGGVLENVNGPASNILTLFDTRLWEVDAEDQNLLWFSKPVVEGAPVEMSDLQTYFVAPNAGTTTSTGPITALAPMDDKLIIFKKDAIFYINGTGPDSTGANSQYSQPIYITSTVGCSNQNSLVLINNGLMFQSDKGIWILGRDLSVSYIGADVQNFNSNTVLSALNVPATNEVRFTLSNNQSLMFDYFVGQWANFQGIHGISSTVYQGLHTFIDSQGNVFQENPGSFLDGSIPVLMSFQTGWIDVAGLRGYERIHEYSFLGTYLSPHKLQIQTAYNYGYPATSVIFTPDNYQQAYGGDPIYGGANLYGGQKLESFRVFAKQQKCKAFQITVQELFDPSYGTIAGQGVTLSGIDCVVILKKGYSPVIGKHSVG
jgi:hypothetical protein